MTNTDSRTVSRVALRNYMSIARCDVRLDPLTLLVGPNGAGKSDFLDAVRFTSQALRFSLDHALRERGRERLQRAQVQVAVHRQADRAVPLGHRSGNGRRRAEAEGVNERCRRAGVRPSMGSVGDCYDNAMAESFFATLECELLDRVPFADPEEARREIFDFIEGFYNTQRRHSALGYQSPIGFETQFRGQG